MKEALVRSHHEMCIHCKMQKTNFKLTQMPLQDQVTTFTGYTLFFYICFTALRNSLL